MAGGPLAIMVPFVSAKVNTPHGSCHARREPFGAIERPRRWAPSSTIVVRRKEEFSHQGFMGSSGSAFMMRVESPRSLV